MSEIKRREGKNMWMKFFVEEQGDFVYIVEEILCSPKQEYLNQCEKIIQANDAICSQIIDSCNCENLITKKRVHHLKLSNEPYPDSYPIGWIKKGSYIQKT